MILDKTWLFAVTLVNILAPGHYFNEKGELVGWVNDIVQSVCEIAKVKCEFVYLDANDACAKKGAHEEWLPGNGLMAGWIDSCLSWSMTMERCNSISYTQPYAKGLPVYFLVKADGTCPEPFNLATTRLALQDGVVTSTLCLKMANATGASYNHYVTMHDAAMSVVNGESDALFSWIPAPEGMMQCPALPFGCDLGGIAQMVKKDSHLPEWWNPAFQTFVDCGCYDALCEGSLEKHGKSADFFCFENLPRNECPSDVVCPVV